jgi:uncharacterized membrane protein HdeD (DUF308 family)
VKSRSIAPMRIAKIGYIALSCVFCALGVLFITRPQTSAAALSRLCGGLLLLLGAVKLVGYFSKDLYRLAFQYDCIFGTLLLVLGAVVLARPDGIMTVLCVALGLYILANGLFRIRMSFEARTFGIQRWWLILAAAAVSGLCGLLLMFRPGAGGRLLMILFGVTLICESILNICTMLTAVKIIRHQKPDVIDVEDYEINRSGGTGGGSDGRPESED